MGICFYYRYSHITFCYILITTRYKKSVDKHHSFGYNIPIKSIKEKTMSVNLRDVPGSEIMQTRFCGSKGTRMLQLSTRSDVVPTLGFSSIVMDAEEALALAQELILFANGQEVVGEQ